MRKPRSTHLVLASLVLAGCASPGPLANKGGGTFEPTANYAQRKVEGWTVYVHPTLMRGKAELASQVLKLLGSQLYQVKRAVPAARVVKLQEVRIWLEAPVKPQCVTYHPDRTWLVKHGYNPDKTQSIEIANPKLYLSYDRFQPWIILHELAHSYHHRVLSFANPKIDAAYARAKRGGAYAKVLHHNGKDVGHYALTDPREFFAEATEAYFGTNDHYPFVGAELARHDPATYALMKEVWGPPR